MKKIFALLVSLSLLGGALAATPALADEVPADATWTQVWFESADGTMLHADVMLPKDRTKNERHPVILSIGPYFGSGAGGFPVPSPTESGPIMRFADLIEEGRIFERGYAYVQVDSRGYGGSGGCNDFGGPGEQMDVKAAVEWAAKQDWSNGKVGMWGKSYDGWTQVMALAQKPKGLAATVIQSPLLETYRGMFMNGVHYDYGWYATPGLYAGYDLTPPSVNDSPPEEFVYPATGTLTNPHCYAQNLAFTKIYDHSLPYWQERDIIKAASKSTVPTLWSHGFLDANTKADNFLPVYSKLQGPKRAWFGQYDHVRGNEDQYVGRDGFMDEAMAWFDHFLKGMPLKRHPNVEVQDGNGDWRTEGEWPPSDARYFEMPVRAGGYVDQRGTGPEDCCNGLYSFTTPAPRDLHFAGPPRVDLTYSSPAPNANLIVHVFDVGPKGEARLITRGAHLLEGSGELKGFELYPQDWILRRGHRFGFVLSGSDEDWFSPLSTNQTVDITKARVSFPFLSKVREPNLEGGPADAMSGVPEQTFPASFIHGAQTKTRWP